MKTLHAWMLLALPLLCGCRTLTEYLSTPAGAKNASDTGSAAVDVAMNPMNPLAWMRLVMQGAGIGAGMLGLYHSPTVVKATGRGIKATYRRIKHGPKKAVPA